MTNRKVDTLFEDDRPVRPPGLLVIGAHPDDAEYKCGRAGHALRDGRADAVQLPLRSPTAEPEHASRPVPGESSGRPTSRGGRRLAEPFGAESEVWDVPMADSSPTSPSGSRVIRSIRSYYARTWFSPIGRMTITPTTVTRKLASCKMPGLPADRARRSARTSPGSNATPVVGLSLRTHSEHARTPSTTERSWPEYCIGSWGRGRDARPHMSYAVLHRMAAIPTWGGPRSIALGTIEERQAWLDADDAGASPGRSPIGIGRRSSPVMKRPEEGGQIRSRRSEGCEVRGV